MLLILAGISLAMLTGQNGLMAQAQNAKDNTEVGQIREKIRLAISTATIEGRGSITYDALESEMEKEFGAGNYEIRETGNTNEWEVVAFTSKSKEVSEIIIDAKISNITLGEIKGETNGISFRYEVVKKGNYSVIRIYPKIQSSHTYGDYAADIIYGKSDKELERMFVDGRNYWIDEDGISDPKFDNFEQMCQYYSSQNEKEYKSIDDFSSVEGRDKEYRGRAMLIKKLCINPSEFDFSQGEFYKDYSVEYNSSTVSSWDANTLLPYEEIEVYDNGTTTCVITLSSGNESVTGEIVIRNNNRIANKKIEKILDVDLGLTEDGKIVRLGELSNRDVGKKWDEFVPYEELDYINGVKKYVVRYCWGDDRYRSYIIDNDNNLYMTEGKIINNKLKLEIKKVNGISNVINIVKEYEYSNRMYAMSQNGEIYIVDKENATPINLSEKIVEIYEKGFVKNQQGKLCSIFEGEDENEYNIETVNGINNVIHVYSDEIALNSDGELYRIHWEWDEEKSENYEVATKIEGIDKAVIDVSIAERYGSNSVILAITEDGKVYDASEDSIATEINGLNNIIEVAIVNVSDEYGAIAKTTDGKLFAWGKNSSGGILGIGNISEQTIPKMIDELDNVTDIYNFSGMFARTKDGDLYEFGSGNSVPICLNKDKNIKFYEQKIYKFECIRDGEYQYVITDEGKIYRITYNFIA